MLEDHFNWCLFADRWVNRDGRDAEELYGAAAAANGGLGASGCPFDAMMPRTTRHRMKGKVGGAIYSGEGASINDVRKSFAFSDPLPTLVRISN